MYSFLFLLYNYYFLVHYDNSSNLSEDDGSPLNQSIKSMLDSNKERKLIKVDFSALARLVVSLCN